MLKVIDQAPDVIVRGLLHFDLPQTLDCGQAFRYHQQKDGLWTGVAGSRRARLSPLADGFVMHDCTMEAFQGFWRGYFDLDRDYEAIHRQYAADPVMARCAQYAPGIRILRQDAWETLVSFIISQNNHVPRIKGIVERLCQGFGKPLEEELYAFPDAGRLAALSETDLAPLRAGWRAGYILDAARQVSEGVVRLDEVAAMPMDQARKALQKIKGVGPKVAECVLLYGMGRLEAFPMDVWMKRAMETLFPGKKPEDFGDLAGIAQQYIFHYSRMEKIG